MEIIKTNKGCLSILGGKTDMGKSTIACFDCSDHIRSGMNVMFFSYEYCQSIIYNKLVNHFDLKFQELFNLNVVDARGWNLELLKESVRKVKGTCDVVYIDYLQLLMDASFDEAINKTEAQRLENKQKLLAELAELAYETKIAIVVLTRLPSSLDLNGMIDYLNVIACNIHTPSSPIKMFIGKDETMNPLIKGSDMSHVIVVNNGELAHFSSINLKQAYKY